MGGHAFAVRLGAVFYHLMAGRPPHDCGTAEELSLKQITETPPPLRKLAPNVNRRLANAIEALIAKSPSARCHSAHDLLVRLRPGGRTS